MSRSRKLSTYSLPVFKVITRILPSSHTLCALLKSWIESIKKRNKGEGALRDQLCMHVGGLEKRGS